MIDQRVVDVIQAVGRETDAPPEIVESIIQRALPSIRLVAQFPKEGETSRPGGCRIGGLPDLPIGSEWPRVSKAKLQCPPKLHLADRPLWFLMQINLAEVAFADVANLLPKSGMLYFFFHWHSADEPEEPDGSLVLFHEDADKGLQRVEAPADLHWPGRFRGFDLLPYLEWTIPDSDDTNCQFGLWDNLKEQVAEAQGWEHPLGPTPVHRMLGYPELLQLPGLTEAEQLLLQVSSDCPTDRTEYGPYPQTGMMWGDMGRIYYIINKHDLKSQFFGDVYACMENQ